MKCFLGGMIIIALQLFICNVGETKQLSQFQTQQTAGIITGMDSNGKLTYYVFQGDHYVPMTDAMRASILENLYEKAKAVCGTKILPQSVTISAAFISLTWDTEKLCKQ